MTPKEERKLTGFLMDCTRRARTVGELLEYGTGLDPDATLAGGLVILGVFIMKQLDPPPSGKDVAIETAKLLAEFAWDCTKPETGRKGKLR